MVSYRAALIGVNCKQVAICMYSYKVSDFAIDDFIASGYASFTKSVLIYDHNIY